MQARTRDWLFTLAMSMLLMLHGMLLWRWIQTDARPEQSICCNLVGPVADRARTDAVLAAGGQPPPWSPDQGLLPELGFRAMLAFNGDPDGLLLVSAAGILLGMVGVYGAGRQAAGPLAGLVAAAVLPCVPAIAFAARRWDVYGAQVAVVTLAAWMLLASRSLSRILPTLGFTALVIAGAFLSPRETDGFLLIGAFGAMGLGAGVRGLLLGRGPAGVRAARWKVLLGGIFVVGVVAWALVTGVEFTSPDGLDYYLRESGHNTAAAVDPSSWTHRGAVLGRLFWRDLTIWLAVPIEIALAAWLLRGRGRAEVATWLVLPLILLSLLSKKNVYYASVVFPALPLVLGLGVAALPGRWLRGLAAATVIAIATTQLLARNDPSSRIGQYLEDVQWQAGDPFWGQVFQTTDYDLRLDPNPDDLGASAAAEMILDAWPEDVCGCGTSIRTLGNGPWDGVLARLLAHRPCLQQNPVPIQEAAVVLGTRETQAEVERTPSAPALFGEVASGRGTVMVYARSEGWRKNRCRRSVQPAPSTHGPER